MAILRECVRGDHNMGGPEMAPHTPQRSERPGEAVTLLYYCAVVLRRAAAVGQRGEDIEPGDHLHAGA